MLSNIIGVLWIIGGLYWTIRPESLKKRLERKINKRMRRFLFGILIVMGLTVTGSVMKMPGIPPKIIAIIGLVMAIKGIMLLTSRTSEKLFEWWAHRPVSFFRIQGIVILLIGVALVAF